MRSQERKEQYDMLHAQAELRFPLEDYPFFVKQLGLKSDGQRKTVLDVACGQGFFLVEAENVVGNIHFYGVDFSHVALGKAVKRLKKTHVVQGDAHAIPCLSGIFDYVVNLGSLEHFEDPVAASSEICRVLAPGGRAMVIVPNRYYLGNLWRVLVHGEEDDQDQEGLTTFMTPKGWTSIFSKGGLAVECVRPYNGEHHIAWHFNRKNGQKSWYENICRRILDVVVKPLIPLNFSQCFIFFLRRADGNAS